MATAEHYDLLSADQWRAVASHWDRRDVNVPLRDTVGRIVGVDLSALDRLIVPIEKPLDGKAVETVLEGCFRSASKVPCGPVLLALYVHSECLRAWEESDDYGMIGEVASALAKVVGRLGPDGTGRELAGWIANYAEESLKQAMAVESGLNCSCPFEMEHRAHDVVAAASGALRRAPQVPGAVEPAYALLRRDAEVTRQYFRLVERVAHAVFAFELDEPGTARAVRSVVTALAKAEESAPLVKDVYATELRAHRRSLEALLAGMGRPFLKVKSARLVYCYPFALDADPVELVEVAGKVYGSDRVRKSALTDAWRGDDPLHREHAGVTLSLPALHVTPTYHDADFFASAEVRLSRLGNHYVRVEAELDDADLHSCNQAIRRVSRSMGEEAIDDGGTRRWSRLTQFAIDAIGDVCDRLGTRSVESVERSFHVVINLRSLAVVEPGVPEREATLADLPGTLGSTLLLNPIFRAATSLEEWVRSPVRPVANLLARDGLAGELAVRTAHSTLLWLPDAPDFLRLDFEQMAEFAASLPGLLYRWQCKLADEAEELAKEMDALRPQDPTNAATSLTLLQERELHLRVLESEVRQLVAFLHSPNLVRTESYRHFLDALYSASSLEAQEHDLTGQFAVLATQYDRVSAITAIMMSRQAREDAEAERRREGEAARADARREAAAADVRRRAEDKLKVALAVLAASSVTGILNLFGPPRWFDVVAIVIVLGGLCAFSVPLLRGRASGDGDPGPSGRR